MKELLTQCQPSTMSVVKLVLVLLWFSACAQAACSNTTICVAHRKEKESECLVLNVSNIVSRLSDLVPNETSCNAVRIYLTSGTHILNITLHFNDSVRETEIHGASHGTPSTIECRNAGIRFSEHRIDTNRIFLSNVTLLHCNLGDGMKWHLIKAALYFKYAHYKIHNVRVENTEGHGLYAERCNEQIVVKCTFKNNSMGHIAIELENYFAIGSDSNALVNISKTKFYGGQYNSTGSGIDVLVSKGVTCKFSVVDSEFQGSQVLVKSRSFSKYFAIVELKVKNTTFINNYLPGVILESIGDWSKMMVAIRNSTFSNNEHGALHILDADVVRIAGCVFTNNGNIGLNVSIAIKLISNLSFVDSEFHRNEAGHVLVTFQPNSINSVMALNMEDSVFTNAVHSPGISIRSKDTKPYSEVIMYNVSFSNNRNGALHTINAGFLQITECMFIRNNRAGMFFDMSPPRFRYQHSRITTYKLSNCVMQENTGTTLTMEGTQNSPIKVTLERSRLEGSQGIGGDCSALHVSDIDMLALKDVNITENYCSGIALYSSVVKLEGSYETQDLKEELCH